MNLPTLPPGDYAFISKRYPLDELAMIETPDDLVDLITRYVSTTGAEIARGELVKVRFRTAAFGEAAVMIWWPIGERMYMLAPRHLQRCAS